MKVTINFSYIRMLEIVLYLELADELGEEVLFEQLLLLDDFEGHDEPCVFLDGHVDAGEFALAEFLDYFKVIYCELELMGWRWVVGLTISRVVWVGVATATEKTGFEEGGDGLL